MARIVLKIHPAVTGKATKIMPMLCSAVSQVTEVRHTLTVIVTPSIVVAEAGTDRVGFAAFWPRPRQLQIWVAGLFPPDMPARERDEHIGENFGHEIAHYEQYRDGRPIQERGVVVRGRNLYRKMIAFADTGKLPAGGGEE